MKLYNDLEAVVFGKNNSELLDYDQKVFLILARTAHNAPITPPPPLLSFQQKIFEAGQNYKFGGQVVGLCRNAKI